VLLQASHWVWCEANEFSEIIWPVNKIKRK
jgi:hypothetical protein